MKTRHHATLAQAFGWLALVLGSLCWAPYALAKKAPKCTVSLTTATLAVPNVTISSNAIQGPIGTPATVVATFTCNKSKFSNQLITIRASVPASATLDPTYGLLYATNIPNISVQLVPQSPANAIGPGPSSLIYINANPAGYGTATVTFVGQLIVTAPSPAGGTITTPATLITNFTDILSGYTTSNTYGRLTLARNTVVTRSACNSTSPTVTLPTVSTSALVSAGATAGTTPFNLNITNCPAGTQLSISMSGTQAGASPTVAKSTGSATNVGVQVLSSLSPPTPVDITGTQKTALGTVPSNGSMVIPYYAQYYATGAVGAGSVQATLTYTLSYP